MYDILLTYNLVIPPFSLGLSYLRNTVYREPNILIAPLYVFLRYIVVLNVDRVGPPVFCVDSCFFDITSDKTQSRISFLQRQQ